MDKETAKKLDDILKAFSKTQTKEIEDYDSALLNDLFEDITGTPREKLDKILQKICEVATRIQRIHLTNQKNNGKKTEEKNKQEEDEGKKDPDDRPNILKKIDKFLNELELPSFNTKVEDYQQREGRIMTISRGDTHNDSTCVIESLNKIVDCITEEQFFALMCKAYIILYQATAELPDEVIHWHRDDLIGEVDPSNDE